IVKRRSRPAAKRARARPAAKTARATAAKTARPAAPKAVPPTPAPDRRDIEEEIYARRKALADLMHSKVLGQADVSQAFRQITATAAEVLEVERSSVWRLIDSGGGIECIDLYERSEKRHSAGVRIMAAAVHRYFEELA